MPSEPSTHETGIVGLATFGLLLDVVSGTIFFSTTLPATAAYINAIPIDHIRLLTILYPIFVVTPIIASVLSGLALYWNRHVRSSAGRAVALAALLLGLLFCGLSIWLVASARYAVAPF